MKEWSNNPYLSGKSLGEVIYSTGRCAAAHGKNNKAARYDYGMNYKHINDVNIFLELIARYIIDELNPSIVRLVETNRTKYIDIK